MQEDFPSRIVQKISLPRKPRVARNHRFVSSVTSTNQGAPSELRLCGKPQINFFIFWGAQRAMNDCGCSSLAGRFACVTDVPTTTSQSDYGNTYRSQPSIVASLR